MRHSSSPPHAFALCGKKVRSHALPKRKGALNEGNQRANRAAREGSARSTCALLASPVCGENVCATTARGVLGGVCARRKCAQEPAAPARRKTRRENCAAREGSTHSTNALRLKHATCTWVLSAAVFRGAVFFCLAKKSFLMMIDVLSFFWIVWFLLGPSTKLFAWGGGGLWRTCATRDDEPRPVWTSLPITH